MELIKIENDIAILDSNISMQIAEFERQTKEIKEKEDELRASILNEMEAKSIVKLETNDLMVTYIAPSERETFDSKTFKADHQELYDEYVKFSPVKSSIRLKVK